MQVELKDLIASNFYDAHESIKENRNDEYWLKGGRGSTKSTFVSIQIILGMIANTDADALGRRRYQNELRDTLYGQFE